MAATEQFSLRWNNFHSNLTSGFHDLLEAADMVDVTLAVDGHFLQAHKLVLSICSPYFKQLFKINPCKHPIVILKDISHGNMKDILEFMYLGEVNVLRENLPSFLKTAESLQVKGLTGDDSSDTSSKKDEKIESFCDNDDEPEYTQLSDNDPIPQYTPTVPSPPQQQKSILGSNFKRSTKNSLINNNSKRIKSETNTSANNVNSRVSDASENTQTNDEDNEFIEFPTKVDQSFEKDDILLRKENFSMDSNNSTNVSPGDISSQDHDGIPYPKDSKSYVYCPYCYRKFVNRYNLKIHIRDKHDASEANLDCVICGKRMRNKSCLRVHMYHHRKQQLQVEETSA